MADQPSPSFVLPVNDGVSTPSQHFKSQLGYQRTPQSDASFPSTLTATNEDDQSRQLDENIICSPDIDLQQFTPTLHANLVSEILSLRREVDNKGKSILSLEEQLSSAELDKSLLNQSAKNATRECRDLQRKLHALEGNSDNALQKLAEERDAVDETVTGLRKRIDQVQRKLKTREEEINRLSSSWKSDKQQWEEQRRSMERQTHIAESRTKMLAKEIEDRCIREEGFQRNAVCSEGRPVSHHSVRPSSQFSGTRCSLLHMREENADSREFYPEFAVDDSLGGNPAVIVNSLAEELGVECTEENKSDGYTSDDAHPEDFSICSRPFSSQSDCESVKARKILGLDVPEEDRLENLNSSQAKEERSQKLSTATEALSLCQRPLYQDSWTQWTPISLPMESHKLDTVDEGIEFWDGVPLVSKTQNTPSKTVSHYNEAPGTSIPFTVMQERSAATASRECQTVDCCLSTPFNLIPTTIEKSLPRLKTCSVSTQTETYLNWTASDELRGTSIKDANSPTISVIGSSTLQSQTEGLKRVDLPNQMKDAACQSDLMFHGLQTTQRNPPSLAVISEKTYHEHKAQTLRQIAVDDTSASNLAHSSPSGGRVVDIVKCLEGENPARQAHEFDLHRNPIQSEREIHRADTDEDASRNELIFDEVTFANLTDDSSGNQEPVRKTLTKTESGWKSVLVPVVPNDVDQQIRLQPPDRPPPSPPNLTCNFVQEKTGHVRRNLMCAQVLQDSQTDLKSLREREHTSHSPNGEDFSLKLSSLKKSTASRDTISSVDSITRLRRPRSPSAPAQSNISDLSLDPPFPVPDRSSSKKLPSDTGSLSPAEGSITFYGGGVYGKKILKKAMRKTRPTSASARSTHQSEIGSSSLGNLSQQSTNRLAISSASPEAIPKRNAIAKSFYEIPDLSNFNNERLDARSQGGFRSQQGSTITSVHGSNASDSVSVVDAIAQTMVGEWMWKYVRRRKSFGLPESAAAEFELAKNSDSNGARHQRWVWLAPYERAVMWSSKQPTSGHALMGKSGRKLIIQSVLDVRDETPLPKDASAVNSFGRSILILTAQRALKFTALNRERHIVWLTALSFLSHSSVIPQTLTEASPVIPHDSTALPNEPIRSISKRQSAASLQRRRVHDSTRVAKGKGRPSFSSTSANVRENYKQTAIPREGSDRDSAITDIIAHHTDNMYDAAEAPLVPRFANHSRKRSQTTRGSMRSKSFKGFANHHANASKLSVHGPEIADLRNKRSLLQSEWMTDEGESSRNTFLKGKRQTGIVISNSKILSRDALDKEDLVYDLDGSNAKFKRMAPRPLSGNFFEAIGTVRMEAFVQGFDDLEARETFQSRDARRKRALLRTRGQSRSLERL